MSLETSNEGEETDPKIIALQNRVNELAKESLLREVDLVITKAKLPNDKGLALSQAVLDGFQALMLGAEMGEDVIKLEDGSSPEAIGKYTREWAKHMLHNVLPKTLKLESTTVPAESTPLDKAVDDLARGSELGKSFWG